MMLVGSRMRKTDSGASFMKTLLINNKEESMTTQAKSYFLLMRESDRWS